MGFPGGSDSKNSPANARHSRDVALILGSEISLGLVREREPVLGYYPDNCGYTGLQKPLEY